MIIYIISLIDYVRTHTLSQIYMVDLYMVNLKCKYTHHFNWHYSRLRATLIQVLVYFDTILQFVMVVNNKEK